MGMPRRIDRELAALDDLHGVVKARLTALHFSGGLAGDPAAVREILQAYVDQAIQFANEDRD